MYIESDLPFDPPLDRPDITLTVQRDGAVASTPLNFEAFCWDRDAGTARFKSYDANGAIVWVEIRQSVLEEAVFGVM